MKNTISYEMARIAGVLSDDNKVVYDVCRIGSSRPSFVCTFTYNGTPEHTPVNGYLWDTAVFTQDGIVAEVAQDGLIARVRAGKGWQVGKSAFDGSAVCVEDGTPVCCDPRMETYWSM